MKSKTLHVLLAEDNRHDYQIISRSLNKDKNSYKISWVQSRKELFETYEENKFDILILDMNLPDANGLEILKEFSEKNIKLPIIFNTVSSTIQMAVQAMHLGATDFIVKDVDGDYIKILPEVIKKSYLSWDNQQARKKAEIALKESEERYRTVVEDQTEFISRYLPDGTLTFVNDAFCRHAGKTRDELIGQSWRASIPIRRRMQVRAFHCWRSR